MSCAAPPRGVASALHRGVHIQTALSFFSLIIHFLFRRYGFHALLPFLRCTSFIPFPPSSFLISSFRLFAFPPPHFSESKLLLTTLFPHPEFYSTRSPRAALVSPSPPTRRSIKPKSTPAAPAALQHLAPSSLLGAQTRTRLVNARTPLARILTRA
ncbi:hypothetical protein DFH09DRAFT_120922 [Mycena vulgaris]|nr:hypothetical protein DFH09DRAFT_120922 [Mycena vulgaris]